MLDCKQSSTWKKIITHLNNESFYIENSQNKDPLIDKSFAFKNQSK